MYFILLSIQKIHILKFFSSSCHFYFLGCEICLSAESLLWWRISFVFSDYCVWILHGLLKVFCIWKHVHICFQIFRFPLRSRCFLLSHYSLPRCDDREQYWVCLPASPFCTGRHVFYSNLYVINSSLQSGYFRFHVFLRKFIFLLNCQLSFNEIKRRKKVTYENLPIHLQVQAIFSVYIWILFWYFSSV